MAVSRETAPSKNVELGGKDGFKRFAHGVTGWVRNARRINGGWHIAMARYFRVFFTTTHLLTPELHAQIGEAYDLLMKVHTAVRIALPKGAVHVYQGAINDLLDAMVVLCAPNTPSECQSIKYHWARHWGNYRVDLGCSAQEKSLERKLGETQKKNFKFTNGRGDIEVPLCHPHATLT